MFPLTKQIMGSTLTVLPDASGGLKIKVAYNKWMPPWEKVIPRPELLWLRDTLNAIFPPGTP